MSNKLQVTKHYKYLTEEQAKYKGAHGGRGSGKSHGFATGLIIRGCRQPTRILCTREFQGSIADSVKMLLEDKIRQARLEYFYESTINSIRGKNGTEFKFYGLKTNPTNIKSMEGIDICWIEEAQRVSKTSLDILIPTIRKPYSEIWATWNPLDPKDPIDELMRHPDRQNVICKELNYDSNPLFPETLREEMEWDKKHDYDKYLHVWKGQYQKSSQARVFNNWRVEEFSTPADIEEFYFGADWGFAIDPSVLVRMYIIDRTIFIDYEAYSVGCDLDYTPALFAGDCPHPEDHPQYWQNPENRKGINGAYRYNIRADSARPETIQFMNKRGFNITPARKGAGSIEEGINFLKNYEIVIHPRCKQSIAEFTYYSYKIDSRTEEVLPILEDKHNHVIDAIRYALENVRRDTNKGTLAIGGSNKSSLGLSYG
jgi:phage terminase large subunit